MSITPNHSRMIAPMRRAIAEVSPIVPDVNPRSISLVFTASPAFSAAKGVAEELPICGKLVMMLVNEIKRKQRAPRAGFIKFWPSPPNSCLTTRIAKTPPIRPIHHGAVDGRLSASSKPVNAADPSLIVMGLFMPFSKTYSVRTDAATVTITWTSALIPKL